MIKNRQIGFFDVDSLQSGVPLEDETSPLFNGLRFRERMLPVADSLNELYDIARQGDHPFVFCSCCSGRFLEPGERDDTLYVPVDQSADEWRGGVDDARMVYLQKVTMSEPKQSYEQACYMVFRHNSNAMEYFKASAIDHWIVFGNGFELCVCSAIKGVLDAGKELWLIEDVIVQSAKGYGDCGTPAGKCQALNELVEMGVKLISLKKFREWYNDA